MYYFCSIQKNGYREQGENYYPPDRHYMGTTGRKSRESTPDDFRDTAFRLIRVT